MKNMFTKFYYLTVFLLLLCGDLFSQCASIVGDYTNGASGTLSLDVFGDGSSGAISPTCSGASNTHHFLALTGSGNLSLVPGNQLVINPSGLTAADINDPGGKDLEIVTYTGTLSGTFGFTPPVVPGLVFSLDYSVAGKVILNILNPCSPDVTPPVGVAPPNQILNTNSTSCNLTNFTIPTPNPASIMDACGIVTTSVLVKNTFTGNSFATSTGSSVTLDTSNNLIIYTFKDAALNEFKDTTIITVLDMTAPSIACPANFSVMSSGGSDGISGDCGAVAFWNIISASDNCPGFTVTQTAGPIVSAIVPVGVNTITLKNTDAAGNFATCSFTITVVDDEAPVFVNTPANLLAMSMNSFTVTCPAAATQPIPPMISDNCGPITPTVTSNPTPTCTGTKSYTFTWKDSGLNSISWTYTYTIIFTGTLTAPASTTAPVSCPADATDPGAPADITDACGRTVSAVFVSRTPASGPSCNGTVEYKYRYTACDGTTTADWTKTYTITYSGGLTAPASATAPVSCPADATDPGAPADITDACGRTVSAVFVSRTPASGPSCNGTVEYKYRYTACDGTTTADWTKTYTITYSGGLTAPLSISAPVSCPADATDPGAPANITDACGRTVSAVFVSRTPASGPSCNGTVEYKYRYTACDGTTTADWSKTYTITYSGGLTAPTSTSATVSCPSDATDPGAPADITDACGRTVSAVFVSRTPASGPSCNGTVEYKYRYTACDGTTTADWTKTYTITYSGGLTAPTSTSATVSCPSDATDPGAPADITDACGRTVTAVFVSRTPLIGPSCNGIVEYKYRYTACDGTTTADWTFTYTINDNIDPTPMCATLTDVTLDATGNYTLTQSEIDALGAGSTDNCSGTLTFSIDNATFDCTHAGTTDASGIGGNRVTRTLTVKDCANNDAICTATFRVMPLKPADVSPINGTVQTVCSDVPYTAINLQSFITNSVNADFTWTASTSGSVSGLNTSGSGDDILDTITNVTNAPVDITYTITPTSEATTCVGPDFTIVVRVNPEPVVANIDVTTCSDAVLGTGANLPTSGSNPLNISHYRFAALNTNGLPSSGGAASSLVASYPFTAPSSTIPSSTIIPAGSRNQIANDQYTNLGQYDTNVIYTLVPYAVSTGCIGDTFTLTAKIHPEPVGASSTTNTPLCSGESFSIDLNDYITNDGAYPDDMDDDVQDVSFSWTISQVQSISSTGALGNISNVVWPSLLNGAIPAATLFGSGAPITNDLIAGNITNGFGFDVIITYTITPTSGFGCIGTPFTVKVRIYQNPDAIISANGDFSLCEGETRTINGLASPSGPTYSYDWKVLSGSGSLSSLTSQTPTLTAGTVNSPADSPLLIQLIVTNTSTGCKDSTTQSFTIDTLPAFTVVDVDSCALLAGGSTAIFDLTRSDAPSSATYHVTNSDAILNVGALASTYTGTNNQTIYARVATSAGCYTIQSFKLIVNPLPSAAISGTLSFCAGDSTELTGPIAPGSTFEWKNGSTVVATTANYFVKAAGTYTLTVSDPNGCKNSSSVNVISNPLPVISLSASESVVCLGQSSTITAGGGVLYAWSDGASVLSSTNSVTVSPTATTKYYVNVTSALGCVSIDSVTITVNPAIIITTASTTNVSCNAGSNGSIDADVSGGTAPYTYLWKDASNATVSTSDVASGLVAGTYTLSVTDLEGCIKTASYAITQPAALALSGATTDVSCNGGSNGAINITATGGTTSYSYAWTGTGVTATAEDQTGLGAGSYSVAVTDMNGCVANASFILTSPSALVGNAIVTPALCHGGNGNVVISASGGVPPYNFASSTSAAITSINSFDLAAGSHTVIVEDQNGCRDEISVTITAPNALVVNTTMTNQSCVGSNDGTATASVTGGTPGFTYSWNTTPLQTTNIATGLNAGSYTVIVTDLNGCTESGTVIVNTNASTTPIVIGCPASLTLQLDDCAVNYSWVAPFISDGCVTTVLNVNLDGAIDGGLTSGVQAANFTVGTYDIAYTSTASALTCNFTVTVVDTVKPTVICPPTLATVSCVQDTVAPYANYLAFLAAGGLLNDNCNPVFSTWKHVGTVLQTSFCTNRDTFVRTYEMLDVYGNKNQCTQKVVVHDDIKPIFVTFPSDKTIDCNAPIDTSSLGAPTASDNCISGLMSGSPSFTDVSTQSPNPAMVLHYNYSITRTWRIEDVCGNFDTRNQIITVQDTIKPVALCQDITVNLDGTGYVTITGSQVNNNSTDICAPAVNLALTVAPSAFTCANVGITNTVTLTVTDVVGNSKECTAVVTVADIVPPVANCKSTFTVTLNSMGMATIDSTDLNMGSSDNCEIKSYGVSQSTFDCTNTSATISVTTTVKDFYNNMSTCVTDVTVIDDTDPIAICRDSVIYLDVTGNASLIAAQLDGGSSDACGPLVFSATPTVFTCSNVGAPIIVAVTVTDANLNASVCTSNVTVRDTIKPNAICQDVIVLLDATGNGMTTGALVNSGSTDACGISKMALTDSLFSCASIASNPNPVILTVTDVNGNSETCTANVTVKDEVKPIALCQDVTVMLDAIGDGSTTAAAVNNGSSDICSSVSLALSKTAFTCSDIITSPNMVMLTVTDASGNTQTCTANVTVEDEVAPTPNCKDATVQLDATGNVTITPATIDDGSTDACGIEPLFIDISTFDCTKVGSNPVTLFVTDNNGNVNSCTANVTVEDNVDPVANCQAVTVSLDATGTGNTSSTAVNDGSSDACGIIEMKLQDSIFTCTNVGGSNAVMLIVTDKNGNTKTCTATVTVQDLVAPVALCKKDTIYLDAAGMASTTPAEIDDASTDACGISMRTLDKKDFTCADIATNPNPVVLTVKDVNGNEATCNSTVLVLDTLSPVFTTLQANYAIGTDPFQCNAVINDTIGLVSDNCLTIGLTNLSVSAVLLSNNFTIPGMSISAILGGYKITSAAPGLPVGINRITVTATDSYGNSKSVSWDVQVNDVFPPIINCPANVSVVANPTTCNAVANWNSPTVSDYCPGLSISSNFSSGATFALNPNPYNVTYTATDAAGNSSSCTFTVAVTGVCTPVAPNIRTRWSIPFNGLFTTNQTKDAVIRLNEIAGQPTSGAITITIPARAGYEYSFDPNQTTANNPNVSVINSDNSFDWSVSYSSSGAMTLTSDSGAVIPANGEVRIAIKVKATGGMSSTTLRANLAAGSGGDVTASNNNGSIGIITN
jgi:hypothetical protein